MPRDWRGLFLDFFDSDGELSDSVGPYLEPHPYYMLREGDEYSHDDGATTTLYCVSRRVMRRREQAPRLSISVELEYVRQRSEALEYVGQRSEED